MALLALLVFLRAFPLLSCFPSHLIRPLQSLFEQASTLQELRGSDGAEGMWWKQSWSSTSPVFPFITIINSDLGPNSFLIPLRCFLVALTVEHDILNNILWLCGTEYISQTTALWESPEILHTQPHRPSWYVCAYLTFRCMKQSCFFQYHENRLKTIGFTTNL